MSWYTLYDNVTGERLGHSELPLEDIPAGKTQIKTEGRKDQGGFEWNEETRQWDVTSPASSVIRASNFIAKFTVVEVMAIKAAARGGDAAALAAVDAFEYARDRGFVELTPTTAGLVDSLVTAGYLTQARKTEILG